MFEKLPFILLIDDDEDDLELLTSSFETLYLRTKTCDSAENALKYLENCLTNNDLPTMIILDYNMPRIDGQQLLSSIKKNKLLKDIPVVMYSTGMSPILKQALLDMGAYDCFVKPVNFSKFTNQLCVFKQMAYSFENAKRFN